MYNWRSSSNFTVRDELTLMEMILASSASPIHIRSIILEISLGVLLDQWVRVTTFPIVLASDKWLAIDRILASPKFMDLRTVEVGVNGEFSLGKIDFSALLPTISSHPRISLITSHNNDFH